MFDMDKNKYISLQLLQCYLLSSSQIKITTRTLKFVRCLPMYNNKLKNITNGQDILCTNLLSK